MVRRFQSSGRIVAYNPISLPRRLSVSESLRRAALSVFFLLAPVVPLTAIAANAASAAPTEPPPDVDLQWGVRIPMRDGVELAATVYKPAGQKDALPVIFTLTP